MTSSKTSDSPLSLVTGSCGFMGSTVVELLLDAGHRVRATDLESVHAAGDDPTRGRYPSISRRPGVEFRPADLTRFVRKRRAKIAAEEGDPMVAKSIAKGRILMHYIYPSLRVSRASPKHVLSRLFVI